MSICTFPYARRDHVTARASIVLNETSDLSRRCGRTHAPCSNTRSLGRTSPRHETSPHGTFTFHLSHCSSRPQRCNGTLHVTFPIQIHLRYASPHVRISSTNQRQYGVGARAPSPHLPCTLAYALQSTRSRTTSSGAGHRPVTRGRVILSPYHHHRRLSPTSSPLLSFHPLYFHSGKWQSSRFICASVVCHVEQAIWTPQGQFLQVCQTCHYMREIYAVVWTN